MSFETWVLWTLGIVLCAVVVRQVRRAQLKRGWHGELRGVPTELVEFWHARDPRHDTRRAPAPEALPATPSRVDVLFQLSRFDRRQLERFQPSSLPDDFEHLLEQFTAARDASSPTQPRATELQDQWLSQQLSIDGHDVLLEPEDPALEDPRATRRAQVDGVEVRLLASADADLLRRELEREPVLTFVTFAEHAVGFADDARVLALLEVPAAAPDPAPAGTSEARAPHSPDDSQASAPGRAAGQSGPQPLSDLGSLLVSHSVSPKLRAALGAAQLIAKGDSAWLGTATHGLVDNAASSVGGWAGARAGAMLGALLGPVGVAAGGFLGGWLGKQWGESVVSGTRERKLRALLDQQQERLARVPKLAGEALAAQAEHLERVARGFDGFELWPTPSGVAKQEVAEEYRRWQRRVRERCLKLRAWLRKQPSPAKRAERGAQLLSEGKLGWSRELLELRCELLKLARQIERERKQLGQ